MEFSYQKIEEKKFNCPQRETIAKLKWFRYYICDKKIE